MNSLGNHKNSCQSENLTFAESVSTVQTTDRMVQGYNYRSNCLRISVKYAMIAFSGIRFELRYDTNRSVMAWQSNMGICLPICLFHIEWLLTLMVSGLVLTD